MVPLSVTRKISDEARSIIVKARQSRAITSSPPSTAATVGVLSSGEVHEPTCSRRHSCTCVVTFRHLCLSRSSLLLLLLLLLLLPLVLRMRTKMAATHLDVGLRCIKYLLCAVNSLFVLTGVMIISVGTTIYAVYEDFSHFLDPSYFSPATLLIVVGILVFIIAFFGCCGALRESTCMVLVFAVSLSLILIMEMAAGIAAYALQDKVKGVLQDKINYTMHQYETNEEARAAVDFMQDRLRCCGYNGTNDWEYVPMINTTNPPLSCYSDFYTASYNTGCISRLSIVIHRSALYIVTGAVAIALIQMTGIIFACMLGRAIRRQKTEREKRKWGLRESIVNGYQPLGKRDPLTTFPVVYMQSPDYPLKGTTNY